MPVPVDDPRAPSVEGTEARGAEVARAFPADAVFPGAAGRTAMDVLDAIVFAPAFFGAATGRTLVARAGVRAAVFRTTAFFRVAVFFPGAADMPRDVELFFTGAAVFRACGRFPAAAVRPVAGFLAAGAFRVAVEAFFTGAAFFVAFRAEDVVAAFFRTGAETFFAPRAAVRAFFFEDAVFRAATPAPRGEALRVTAAVRAAERTDVLRADVPDLRGAGFLAI